MTLQKRHVTRLPAPAKFRRCDPMADRILVIDNFDSFTYNLVHQFGRLGAEPRVMRNDVSLAAIREYAPHAIVISPGPGDPAKQEDFRVSGEAIAEFSGKIPILGVCLGHQGIVHHFGGKIVRARVPMHGKTSVIDCRKKGILEDVAGELVVMRYHSLVAERESLPACLEIIATSRGDNEIMAIRHGKHPTFGVQFHPESLFTEKGDVIIRAFLRLIKAGAVQ